MKTTHVTARWGLLALLALVVSVGCQDTETLLPAESNPEPEEWVTKAIIIPESWAKQWENRDHCAEEERAFRETGKRPPVWESYCQNPRPLRTGLITGESLVEERRELKLEWEERYGLTPLGATSK